MSYSWSRMPLYVSFVSFLLIPFLIFLHSFPSFPPPSCLLCLLSMSCLPLLQLFLLPASLPVVSSSQGPELVGRVLLRQEVGSPGPHSLDSLVAEANYATLWVPAVEGLRPARKSL